MDKRLRDERIAQARTEIARRIRRVCATLPPAEFDKLLDRMTLLHCKYEVFPHIPELAEMAELESAIQGEVRRFKTLLDS